MVSDTVLSTSNGGQPSAIVDNVALRKDSVPPTEGDAAPAEDIGLDVLRRARRAARPARPGSALPANPPPAVAPTPSPAASFSASPAGTGSDRLSPDDAPAGPEPVAVSRRSRRRRRAAPRDDSWSGAGPHSRDPQAVGSVAAGLFAERGWDRTLSQSRVLADWASMVGSEVASQSTAVSLRDGELRISASSTAWATQLRLLAPTLLARISEQVGAGVVTSLAISGPTAPSWKHGPRVFQGRGPRDTYG